MFCKVCKKTFTVKGGNTANLFQYLKQNHRHNCDETQKSCEDQSLSAVAEKLIFFISSWMSLLQNTLKYHDIISRLYRAPLYWGAVCSLSNEQVQMNHMKKEKSEW